MPSRLVNQVATVVAKPNNNTFLFRNLTEYTKDITSIAKRSDTLFLYFDFVLSVILMYIV